MQTPFLAPMTVWATAEVEAHKDATNELGESWQLKGKVDRQAALQSVAPKTQVPASPMTSALHENPTQQAHEQTVWLLAGRSGPQLLVPVNTVTPTAKGVVGHAPGLHAWDWLVWFRLTGNWCRRP